MISSWFKLLRIARKEKFSTFFKSLLLFLCKHLKRKIIFKLLWGLIKEVNKLWLLLFRMLWSIEFWKMIIG